LKFLRLAMVALFLFGCSERIEGPENTGAFMAANTLTITSSGAQSAGVPFDVDLFWELNAVAPDALFDQKAQWAPAAGGPWNDIPVGSGSPIYADANPVPITALPPPPSSGTDVFPDLTASANTYIRILWMSINPPGWWNITDPFQITVETPRETEIDLANRGITAGVEGRDPEGSLAGRSSIAPNSPRDPDATVEGRTKTAGVGARSVEAAVEDRTLTGGVSE
jgi:hypothetical protein